MTLIGRNPSGFKWKPLSAGRPVRQCPRRCVGGEVLHVPVASVEDMVLAKLQWYRKGGEISERQWTDVLNLIRVNQALDLSYVHTWAERLGVRDLLQRALMEASADQ